MVPRTAVGISRVVLIVTLTFAAPGTLWPSDEWKPISDNNGVKIESQLRRGTSINELRAVGEIAAPIRAVRSLLEDLESYPRFMRYVTECRLLKREADALISYQRISAPLISDRDYALRVRNSVENSGGVFRSQWEVANALGPAEQPRVVRVKVNEGSWTLEAKNELTTRATYRLIPTAAARSRPSSLTGPTRLVWQTFRGDSQTGAASEVGFLSLRSERTPSMVNREITLRVCPLN